VVFRHTLHHLGGHPWFPWSNRFSLLTLLVTMTLVAAWDWRGRLFAEELISHNCTA
jgi:hypothetical protein